jgi:hypothetical protein
MATEWPVDNRLVAAEGTATTRIKYLVFLMGLHCIALNGCSHGGDSISDMSSKPGASRQAPRRDEAPQLSDDEYRKAKEEALAFADKQAEERLRNPTSKQSVLPNFPTGPGLPLPTGINFYEDRDYYPGYLLCTYNVQEHHYDETNEPAWFEAAILQMRGTGCDRFARFKWVAIIISNRAEHKGASTFEQCHKVGAIFNIDGVCDLTRSPAGLVAVAKMDRHPFVYDPARPSPGEQQRWTIVERDSRSRALKE